MAAGDRDDRPAPARRAESFVRLGFAGAYALSGVPAADGNGELWVNPNLDDGAWQRGRYGMSWAGGQNLTVNWLPGYVECSGQTSAPLR